MENKKVTVKMVKENLDGFLGTAHLVKTNVKLEPKKEDYEDFEPTEYFIVSGVNAMFSGWEVLVFPSDKDGEVQSWAEVVGGRDIDHETAIDWLVEKLEEQIKEKADAKAKS